MKYLCIYEGENPSAGIVSERGIEMFVEEERLNRIKHASFMFPIRSVLRCLKDTGTALGDIGAIAYPWDLASYAPGGEVDRHYETANKAYPPDSATLNWQRANLKRNTEAAVTERIRFNVARHVGGAAIPPLRFANHHRAHAWAGLIGSGLKECLILVTDGSGETLCTSVWRYKGGELEELWGEKIPRSLGWLYAAATEYLGFDAYDGEYKVMGITGLPSKAVIGGDVMRELIHEDGDGYHVSPKYIHHGKHTWSNRFTDYLVDLLGFKPLAKNEPLTDSHIAFAKAVQGELEKHLKRICAEFLRATGLRELAVAGGVALNVKANGYLLTHLDVDSVYANPFPNDTGAALGVPMEHDSGIRNALVGRIDGLSFLGPVNPRSETEKIVRFSGYSFTVPENPAATIAEHLNAGKVIALCAGRSESGQRALGHRSIIGDPRSQQTASRINDIIKRREPWRPLCPSILDGDAARYAQEARISPYMMIAVDATAEAKENIPAVVHTDGSIRPQIVRESDAGLFYDIIKSFKAKSGVGAVINTSFNVDGQPMVESPKDAISTFAMTDIDVLFLDGFLLEKTRQPLQAPIKYEKEYV
jgi:carbamoyltransferase